MRVCLLLLLGCVLWVSELDAQQSLLLNRNYRPSRTGNSEVVFMYYRYTSEVLDLIHFKSLYPEVQNLIPDKVKVSPPDLSLLEDTSYAVAYLPSGTKVPGIVVFMVVGNTQTDFPLFFVDANLDRNFRNDGEPIVFPIEKKQAELQFEQRFEGRIYTYQLNLLNPLGQRELAAGQSETSQPRPTSIGQNSNTPISQLPIGQDERRRIYSEAAESSRAYDRISLQFSVLMGFGKLSYNYFDPATRFPTKYGVDFNTKGVGFVAQYRIKNLKIGGYTRYENLFYWSSDKYTRLGDPYQSCYAGPNNQLVCNEVDNVRRDINRDILPRNRFSYGLNLAYTFRLSRMLYLEPYVNLYAQQYTDKTYIADRSYREETAYLMNTQFGQEVGVMMVADFSARASVIFSAALTSNGFRPSGFFDRDDVGGLRVTNLHGSFGLGTQIRL